MIQGCEMPYEMMGPMAKVAVVGVGAIGGVLAGLLHTAGMHEITLCTRRAIDGLTVETPEGTVRVSARNVTDPLQKAPLEVVDWVVVATKTYDAAGAAAWFDKLCGPATRVAVVQNGVEHRERFADYLTGGKIVPVIIDCPAERRAVGTVVQRGIAQMRVAEGMEGSAFAALFAGTHAAVELTDDFVTAAWRKLCINSAGALSALTMKPAGVMQDEALGRVALDIVAECVAVGRAEGARLDDGTGQKVLEGYRASPADSINSMLADRLAGRPMEIDARNGVIVRKGAQHGIATPANRMVVALLLAM
jgi:2-dehydropantoate 2-reductase